MPPFLKSHRDGVCLFAKVLPRSSRNEIGRVVGNELKIKITAPPVDSAANEALVEFLVEILGCGRGAVQLLRGQTSRHKVILIRGVTESEIERRLTPN